MKIQIRYFLITLLAIESLYAEESVSPDIRYVEVSGRWFGSAGSGVLRLSILGYEKSIVQVEWLKSESNENYKLSKFCSWSSPALDKDIRNVSKGPLRQNFVLSSVEVNVDSALYRIEQVSESGSDNLVLNCTRLIKSVDSCVCSFMPN